MELLPSGSVLGGASLYLESDKGRILYAPHLQTQKVSTVRQMQLKKAHTLIVGAYHADPSTPLPNRKKEKERLLNTVRNFVNQDQYPVIVCQSIATAQEITKCMADENIPLAVHSTIFKINKIYEAYGSQLGPYSLYSAKYTKKKVLLFPFAEKGGGKLRSPLPEGPVLYVEDTLAPSSDPTAFREVNDRFFISSTCDGKDLREVISAVAPKEVYFFGPYAKRFSEEFKNSCKIVRPLYSNDQPTLF
jgi:Cft2 family RNA processing exonuclease